MADDIVHGESGKTKKRGNIMEKETNYKVSIEGNLGRNLVTPRGLGA